MSGRVEFYAGLATLLVAAATVALLIAQPFAPPRSRPSPLAVKVADSNGRLRLDWDARHPTVQAADAASLEVQDGETFHRYPVEKRVLEAGGLDYVHQSPDVTLTLTFYRGSQPDNQIVVRTVSAIAAAPAPAVKPPEPAKRTQQRQRSARQRRR